MTLSIENFNKSVGTDFSKHANSTVQNLEPLRTLGKAMTFRQNFQEIFVAITKEIKPNGNTEILFKQLHYLMTL